MSFDKKTVKYVVLIVILAGLALWVALNPATFVAGLSGLLSLLNPLIIGFIMAYILNILLKKVEGLLWRLPKPAPGSRRAKIFPGFCRVFGIIISVVLLAAFLALVILLLIPAVREACGMLVAQFPGYWEHLQNLIASLSEKYGLSKISLPDLSVNYDKIVGIAQKFFTTGFTSAMGFMSSLVSIVINGLLGFVFAIYMLSGKEKLAAQSAKLVKAYASEKAADEIFYIAKKANEIFSKFIVGQVTDAAILGLLCFITMTIFRFPYSGMIGILIGFTALIPVFGAFIGTGIGAFLILMTDPIKALWFIIMVVILQQIDGNLIYPRVVGSSVGLPAIWTLFAVLVGGSAGGIMGMLFGVPLVGLIYTLIRRDAERRLERKASMFPNG